LRLHFPVPRSPLAAASHRTHVAKPSLIVAAVWHELTRPIPVSSPHLRVQLVQARHRLPHPPVSRRPARTLLQVPSIFRPPPLLPISQSPAAAATLPTAGTPARSRPRRRCRRERPGQLFPLALARPRSAAAATEPGREPCQAGRAPRHSRRRRRCPRRRGGGGAGGGFGGPLAQDVGGAGGGGMRKYAVAGGRRRRRRGECGGGGADGGEPGEVAGLGEDAGPDGVVPGRIPSIPVRYLNSSGGRAIH
jgi:hypothetical protein